MSCEPIREAMKELQAQLHSLEMEMQHTGSEERGELLNAIKRLLPHLREKQGALQQCLQNVPRPLLPGAVDYEPYLTLSRTQDGSGGCGGFTTMHVFDIQMERAAPYSPDGSCGFNGYVWNDSTAGHNGAHDPRIAVHGLNQMQALKTYGCCPETSFPTNYDPPSQLWPNEPAPSDQNFAEAKHYRVAEIGGEPGDTSLQYGGIPAKSIDEIKTLLVKNGPLFVLRLFDGHVVALIGYDDTREKFKIVNSASGNTNGIEELSYDYVLDRFQNHDASVKWIEIDPVKLVQQGLPVFTARIRIRHLVGRRFLAVRIGVEGQAPLIVWDRNCSVNMLDHYLDLCIDVPLPDYAHQFWPPSKGNWWYVEVTDHSPVTSPAITGHIEDVVLVQRLFARNGSCRPLLYRSSYRNFEIARGGTVRVFVPARKVCSCSLRVDQPQVVQDTTISFSGTATVQVAVSNTQNLVIPLAAKRISVSRIDHEDPIEGNIEYPIGQTESDAHGHFTLLTVVDRSARYRAIATEADGTVLALSNHTEVIVG